MAWKPGRAIKFLCFSLFICVPTDAVPDLSLQHSPLLYKLLEEFGAGGSTAIRSLDIAQAALRMPTLGLQQFANIDQNVRHAERDLHAWARKSAWRELAPSLYSFPIHYASVRSHETTIADGMHAALLPHELFYTISAQAPDLFDVLFGSPKELQSWWDDAKRVGGSWHENHPVINDVANPALRVPLGIHGDDAGVHGNEQVLVITWGSVVPRLPTLDSRMLFSMIKVSDIYPHDTLQTVYDVLRWSFECLACGKFPRADHAGKLFSKVYMPQRFKMAGKPLAGGRRGAWAEMRGDWKYQGSVVFTAELHAR